VISSPIVDWCTIQHPLVVLASAIRTGHSPLATDLPLRIMGEELTEAEAKVYDRQLRVWGVEVQKRHVPAKCTCLWSLWIPGAPRNASSVQSVPHILTTMASGWQAKRSQGPAGWVLQRGVCRGALYSLCLHVMKLTHSMFRSSDHPLRTGGQEHRPGGRGLPLPAGRGACHLASGCMQFPGASRR
jgi:hypothetical protein